MCVTSSTAMAELVLKRARLALLIGTWRTGQPKKLTYIFVENNELTIIEPPGQSTSWHTGSPNVSTKSGNTDKRRLPKHECERHCRVNGIVSWGPSMSTGPPRLP